MVLKVKDFRIDSIDFNVIHIKTGSDWNNPKKILEDSIALEYTTPKSGGVIYCDINNGRLNGTYNAVLTDRQQKILEKKIQKIIFELIQNQKWTFKSTK